MPTRFEWRPIGNQVRRTRCLRPAALIGPALLDEVACGTVCPANPRSAGVTAFADFPAPVGTFLSNMDSGSRVRMGASSYLT